MNGERVDFDASKRAQSEIIAQNDTRLADWQTDTEKSAFLATDMRQTGAERCQGRLSHASYSNVDTITISMCLQKDGVNYPVVTANVVANPFS